MRRRSTASVRSLLSTLAGRRNGRPVPVIGREDYVAALANAFPTRIVRDGKVAVGKDGWLFLANDENDVIAQMTGKLRLSQEELDAWRTTIGRRAAQIDVPYLFAVAPDSHCIYPEKLPDGIDVLADRPVHQLLAHLADLSE